jgi:putative SOS response-associated peptidase YedK
MQGDMPKNVKAAHFGGIRSAIITWNDSFAPHTRQVHNPARQLTGLENMCGRYSLICIDDLGNRFRVHNPMIGARSKFNVAPASEMPVIVQKKMPEIALMRWGLVPHWTKDSKTAPKPVNARAESLAEKPMFAPLLQSGRCLVPASGFYEWKKEGTVILTRENEERWLSYDPPSVQDLARILVPYPASAMARVAVSDLVNSPAVDDERVIRPLFGLT